MEYDTEWTTGETICPHCGKADRDIGELGEGEHELECGYCGEKITVSVYVSYNYTTVKGWES